MTYLFVAAFLACSSPNAIANECVRGETLVKSPSVHACQTFIAHKVYETFEPKGFGNGIVRCKQVAGKESI